MIDATELRIGNLILFEDGSIIEVRGIHPSGKNIHDGKKWIEVFRLNPIPLTGEELIKFGWKYLNGKRSGTMCSDFEGKLDVDLVNGEICVKSHYEGEDFYRKLINIKSVHQIQNFYFALQGTELTIQ